VGRKATDPLVNIRFLGPIESEFWALPLLQDKGEVAINQKQFSVNHLSGPQNDLKFLRFDGQLVGTFAEIPRMGFFTRHDQNLSSGSLLCVPGSSFIDQF